MKKPRLFNIFTKRAKILPHTSQGIGEGYGAMPKERLEAYSRAYRVMAPIFVGVNAIMGAAASVPLRWYEIPKGGEETDKERLAYNHALPMLFRFVNYFDTGYDIAERLYGSLLLTGNFAFLAEPAGAPQPTELWPLRGDRLVVVPGVSQDPKQWILRYDYYNDLGTPLHLDPRDVLHLKLFNPYDAFYGQGFVSAARTAIDFDTKAVRFNTDAMRSPFPDVVLKDTTPGVPMPPQDEIDRIKKVWNDTFGSLLEKGKKVAVVGSLEPQIMKGLTPREVEWILGRKDARQEMYQVLGIPPVMANTPEEKYATALVQKRIFWENAVIPKQTKVAAALTQWAQARWGENILCAYDYSEVAALQEDMVAKASTWVALTGRPIASLNEGRSAFKLPAVDAGDGVAMSSILAIQAGTEVLQKPRGKSLTAREKRERLIVSEHREALWRKFIAGTEPWERKFEAAMREYFDRLQAKILHASGWSSGLHTENHAARISEWEVVAGAFDDEEANALRDVAFGITPDIVQEQGASALAKLGIGIDFDLHNPNVAKWIEKKVFKFADEVGRTTEERLRAALLQAEDAGATLEETKKVIESIFASRKNDCANIARTEVNSAANAGIIEGWRQSNVVEGKGWLSARDTLVRDSHADMDGEVVSLDEPFSNGLDQPGDPSGDPAEICNCRCTITAEISQEKMLVVLSTRIERRLYPGRAGSRLLEAQNYKLTLARIESAVGGNGKEGKHE